MKRRPVEWLILGLTALFVLTCALVLILRAAKGPDTGLERAVAYAPESLDTRTERERLNEILGIQAEEAPPDTAGRLNINTATPEELQELPGIGPVLAERIIRYREANGPFEDVSHLRDVTGIGAGVYGKIQDLICVEN